MVCYDAASSLIKKIISYYNKQKSLNVGFGNSVHTTDMIKSVAAALGVEKDQIEGTMFATKYNSTDCPHHSIIVICGGTSHFLADTFYYRNELNVLYCCPSYHDIIDPVDVILKSKDNNDIDTAKQKLKVSIDVLMDAIMYYLGLFDHQALISSLENEKRKIFIYGLVMNFLGAVGFEDKAIVKIMTEWYPFDDEAFAYLGSDMPSVYTYNWTPWVNGLFIDDDIFDKRWFCVQ